MHTACVLCVFWAHAFEWKWARAVSLMRQYKNRFYSNADHTRRIRKGRDVTKSDACAQKTHRTHAVCINFSLPRGVQRVHFSHVWWRTYCPLIYGYYTPKQIISKYATFKGAPNSNCNAKVPCFRRGSPTATAMRKCPAFEGGPQQPLSCVKYSLLLMKGPPTATAMWK